MSTLTDDITAARQSGQSDDTLIQAYKAYDPAKGGDIDAALSAGRTPKDILDALGAYDGLYGAQPATQGIPAKAQGALQEGVSSELTGLGTTAKETLGPGVISQTLGNLGKAVAPSNYTSASQGLGDTTKTLGDRAGYIPRSLAEGAPGLATDIAAGAVGARVGGALGVLGGPLAELTVPAGAAIGGMAGFGGSYLLRNYGTDAEHSATARTGDPNATPNSDDKTRALAAGLTSAALSRVGVGSALGSVATENGADAILPAIRGLGKAMATDAGTSVASDAVNSAVVDHANPLSDPSGLALAGAQGAAVGTVLKGVSGAADVNNGLKFQDIDPVNGQNLANLYTGRDFSTPSEAYGSMKDVDALLDLHADHWQGKTQPQLDALDAASGYRDDTGLLLKSARQGLDNGNVVDQGVMDTLRDRLGDFREGSSLLDTLDLQNTQNKVKAVGNFRDGPDGTGTFGDGIADTDLARNILNPIGKLGKLGTGAVGLDLGIAHYAPTIAHLDPTTAALLGVAHIGTYLGAKAIDATLGNSNPLKAFADRFGLDHEEDGASGTNTATADKPSFVQTSAVAGQTGSDIGALAQKAILRQRATNTQSVDNAASFAALAVAKAARSRVTAQAASPPQDQPLPAQEALRQARTAILLQAASKGSDGATGAPKGSTASQDASGLRHIRVGDQVVSFDPNTVAMPDRYAASVERRMQDRNAVIAQAKAVVPEGYHGVLDTLHTDLNHNSSNNRDLAYERVEDAVNQLPNPYRLEVFNKLDDPKLWASFAR